MLEEINDIKENHRKIEKYGTNDFPKIVQNINSLEAYVLTSLKSQLNEDNKKS